MIFHSVDVDPARGKNGWEDAWRKRYVIGVMLLDLEDPSRVIGLCKVPLMAPEGPEEQIEGFRTNALFPCGMILEDDQTGALLQRERHGGALGHGQARRPDLALHGKTLNPKMGLPRLRQPKPSIAPYPRVLPKQWAKQRAFPDPNPGNPRHRACR